MADNQKRFAPLGNLNSNAGIRWQRHHVELSPAEREKVLKISASQIDRLLARYMVKGRRRPAPANEVRRQVPVRTGLWEVSGPGWVEVDTVAHCGGNMGGCFVWSVCITDIFSGWTEVRASWNRSDRVVHAALRDCHGALPLCCEATIRTMAQRCSMGPFVGG